MNNTRNQLGKTLGFIESHQTKKLVKSESIEIEKTKKREQKDDDDWDDLGDDSGDLENEIEDQ